MCVCTLNRYGRARLRCGRDRSSNPRRTIRISSREGCHFPKTDGDALPTILRSWHPSDGEGKEGEEGEEEGRKGEEGEVKGEGVKGRVKGRMS